MARELPDEIRHVDDVAHLAEDVRLTEKTGVEFAKGPIPDLWVIVAQRVDNGPAAKVGHWLWKEAGISARLTFRFGAKKAAGYGLSRNCYHTGLRHLREAGLISVRRGDGEGRSANHVTINPVPGQGPWLEKQFAMHAVARKRRFAKGKS